MIVAIEEQKIETKPIFEQPSRPVWDELFQFEITTGQDDLKVVVANKDSYSSNDMIGKVDIPLTMLQD